MVGESLGEIVGESLGLRLALGLEDVEPEGDSLEPLGEWLVVGE